MGQRVTRVLKAGRRLKGQRPPMSQEVKNYAGQMAGHFYGRDLNKCIEKEICVACGKPAQKFKDRISSAEFKISGLCQECQDKFFW